MKHKWKWPGKINRDYYKQHYFYSMRKKKIMFSINSNMTMEHQMDGSQGSKENLAYPQMLLLFCCLE